MRVVIIRHGRAHHLGDAGANTDEARMLTQPGREQVQRVAQALKRLEPDIELVLTSPYTRAVETAMITATVLGLEIEQIDDLASGARVEPIVQMLTERKERTVALCGHQPTLGELIAYTSVGNKHPMHLKPAGMACLEFGRTIDRGCASLEWLLQPSQLEELA